MAARELIFDILAIDRASRVFEKVGLSAETMGAKAGTGGAKLAEGMLAATAVVVGIGVESLKMAGNFEAAVTRLHTSAGETKGNLGMVSQGMLDMAGKVGFTAQQLAEGMYIVESAGHHGADALNVLKYGAQGARTEGSDLGTVLDAVTTIMRDFGVKAGDAATITGNLIAATSVGKTNFQDLAGAMSAVMPKAAILHMKFPEIAADLASMTAHGMSAQQAAENMADALKHLAGPTLAQSKIMADYGIQAHDVSQKLSQRGLAGTMQYLSDMIMSHMGPAGSQLKTVFNQSQLAAQDAKAMFDGMPPSIQQMARAYQDGKISMKDWTVGLKNIDAPSANLLKQWAVQENAAKGFSRTLRSGGDASKTYAAALQGVTGDQASMAVAMMLSGENTKFVNDNIKTVSHTMKDSHGNVAGFTDQQATLNGKLSDLKAGASSLGVELGQRLMPAAKTAADKLNGLVSWMTSHQDAVIGFGRAIGVLAIAVATYTAVQWLMNIAMLANPIGLIVLALAGLTVAFIDAYTHSETFRKVVTVGLDAVKLAFWTLSYVAVTVLQGMMNSALDFAGTFIHAAALAFGWVPGLGDKLWAANRAIDKFKTDANASLDKVKNDIKLNVNTTNAKMAYDILAAQMSAPVTVPVWLNVSAYGTSAIANAVISGNAPLANSMMAANHYGGGGAYSTVVSGSHRTNGGQRASGGPVEAGMTYRVGENGPEDVTFGANGYVHDAKATKAGAHGGGGNFIIENYHEGTKPIAQIGADLMFRFAHAG